MKRVAIVGYGSIGQRHFKNFSTFSCELAVVSRRTLENLNKFGTISDCLKDFKPEIVFICNETSEHKNSLDQLMQQKFQGLVVVEKPIFDLSDVDYVQYQDLNIRVSYNFRFHPLLIQLKRELSSQKIISSHVYVGQYLPTWRPHLDYTQNYSAMAEKGGGVLLDLSHELDYAQWLFGKATGVFSLQGHWSSLKINSVDTCAMVLSHQKCPATTLQMNYLDRITQRFIIVNTDQHTFKVDFMAKKIFKDQSDVTSDTHFDSYLEMTQNILKQNGNDLTSYQESLDVMSTIKGAVKSNQLKTWSQL